jgi:hypothetical protein
VTIQVKIVAEEQSNVARAGAQVFHLDLLHVHIQLEIDGIATPDLQAQRLVFQRHLRHETVIVIAQVFFPGGTHPREAAVDPDAESKLLSSRVVLLAYPGEVDVANAIIQIEIDEEVSIAHWDVSGHGFSPRPGSLLPPYRLLGATIAV